MTLRRSCRKLLVILLFVPVILNTTFHSCKQQESFWQGLQSRLRGGIPPWTKDDPGQIGQVINYIECAYETQCPSDNTGWEYWLYTFGASSAPERTTIHNGMCQIGGHIISLPVKMAEISVDVYTSIQDLGYTLAEEWNGMVPDRIVSAYLEENQGYPFMEDLVDFVTKIYEQFQEFLTIMHPAENDHLTAMEAENGIRFACYIMGICIVSVIVLIGLLKPLFSRYSWLKFDEEVAQPNAATITICTQASGVMTYTVVYDSEKVDKYVQCLSSRATADIRTPFLKKLRKLRTLKDLGAAKQRSLVSVQEWYSSRDKIYLVLPNMPLGELLGNVRRHPDEFGYYAQITVAKQILAAVVWLHQVGWAHLNIHPGAIFVTGDFWQVKLGKFTYATEINKNVEQYDLEPNCCAPEVLRKQPYDAEKADLWALGSLMYFCFSRVLLPFRGATPSPKQLNACFSGDDFANSEKLVKLMTNLLYSEPKQRPKLETLDRAFIQY